MPWWISIWGCRALNFSIIASLGSTATTSRFGCRTRILQDSETQSIRGYSQVTGCQNYSSQDTARISSSWCGACIHHRMDDEEEKPVHAHILWVESTLPGEHTWSSCRCLLQDQQSSCVQYQDLAASMHTGQLLLDIQVVLARMHPPANADMCHRYTGYTHLLLGPKIKNKMLCTFRSSLHNL